jgi:DNA modification methylase
MSPIRDEWQSDDGSVRLLLGDCLDILPTLEAGSVDCLLTDPPYGISFDTNYKRFTGGVTYSRLCYPKVLNDEKPFDPTPFLKLAKTVILFGANNYSDKLPQGSWIVWDKRYKQKPLMTSDAEVAWCNRGHGVYVFNHYWDGFMKESERGIKRVHPTQKPVKLFEFLLEKYSKEGDTIFDPFMGSGTTGVACKNLNRNFIGIELDKDYYEIACKRINNT